MLSHLQTLQCNCYCTIVLNILTIIQRKGANLTNHFQLYPQGPFRIKSAFLLTFVLKRMSWLQIISPDSYPQWIIISISTAMLTNGFGTLIIHKRGNMIMTPAPFMGIIQFVEIIESCKSNYLSYIDFNQTIQHRFVDKSYANNVFNLKSSLLLSFENLCSLGLLILEFILWIFIFRFLSNHLEWNLFNGIIYFELGFCIFLWDDEFRFYTIIGHHFQKSKIYNPCERFANNFNWRQPYLLK